MDTARTAHTASTTRPTELRATHLRRTPRIDWAREARLGIVLSVFAALFAIGLAGRVSDRVLVTTVIVAASLIAWRRIEPLGRPLVVPARRR